jgi:hypothetical protein
MLNVIVLLVVLGLATSLTIFLGVSLQRGAGPTRIRAASMALTVVLGVGVLIVLSQLLPPGEARIENNVEHIGLRGELMAGLVVAVGVGALVARRWHPAVGTGVAIGALVLFGCNALLFCGDLSRGF